MTRFNCMVFMIYILLWPTMGPSVFFFPWTWFLDPEVYLREGKYVIDKYYENPVFTSESYIDTVYPKPEEENMLYADDLHTCFHNLVPRSELRYSFLVDKNREMHFAFVNDETHDYFWIDIRSYNFDKNILVTSLGYEFKFIRKV